jgi:hypothetical protein
MVKMKTSVTALLSGAILLALATVDANAASIEGKCEYRSRPARSKADGKVRDLTPGAMYSISVADGNGGAQVSTAGGEIQRSFDSNGNDIAAGDAPISAGSLSGGSATFKVYDAVGAEVASRTVICNRR